MEIPKFNLEIAPTDIIVVTIPTDNHISSVKFDVKSKSAVDQFPFARPALIAKVGSAVGAGEEGGKIVVKEGDFVYLKSEFVHASTLLGFDEFFTHKNPIICPGMAIVAKEIYSENSEKFYEEQVQKLEAALEFKKAKASTTN